jgi:hypothetical protein
MWLVIRRFCLSNDGECSVFDVLPGPTDLVDPDFSHGWLCFERGGERRRLAPIPADWERLSEQDLSQMWTSAKRVARIEL